MNADLVKWLVTGAFAAHGAGMVGAAGYLPWSMSSTKGDFIGSSWLLGNGTLAVIVGVVVWAVAGAAFVAAGIGFWRGDEWWRTAAWAGSLFTLLAIGLWVGHVPFGVYVGGLLAVDTIAYLLLV